MYITIHAIFEISEIFKNKISQFHYLPCTLCFGALLFAIPLYYSIRHKREHDAVPRKRYENRASMETAYAPCSDKSFGTRTVLQRLRIAPKLAIYTRQTRFCSIIRPIASITPNGQRRLNGLFWNRRFYLLSSFNKLMIYPDVSQSCFTSW